ncbi:MAG: DNA polymerase III subunit alpha, partial [Acidimicrobiales bacterium]
VNVSEADYGAGPSEVGDGGPGTIPFGLAAVRNVGSALVSHVLAERERGGPYTDFYDFCARVDPSVLNKRTVESLIKAGAFDSLGHPRKGLCMVFEQIVDRVLARRREADSGIMSLFGEVGGSADGAGFDDSRVPVPEVELDKDERLALEKEMLGLYLSDHPLLGLEHSLRRVTECSLSELLEAAANPSREGEVRTVGGVCTGVSRRFTRRGDPMATLVLEDLRCSVETFVFPKVMAACGHLLAEDAVVVVRGRLDLREDVPRFVALEITRPELRQDDDRPLRLRLPAQALSDRTVGRLRELLAEHPGPTPVLLHVGSKVLRLPPELSVEPRTGLVGELRVLLGPQAVVVLSG